MYLPDLHAGLGALSVALVALVLVGLGSTSKPGQITIEARLVVGWGVLCVALTVWAVALPFDLRVPLLAMAVLGATRLAVGWRGHALLPHGAGLPTGVRMLLLTFPLWAVMVPARPAGIDTWWNLLPNAAYLFNHGRLPTVASAESYSFLPAAPYDTQFIAFAASVLCGGFAENALTLFNVVLLCAASLRVARVAAQGSEDDRVGSLPWWACALGCLICVPLNAGFTPNVFLSPYGETGLAVTALFAVSFSVSVLDDFARSRRPRGAIPLALTLAAMVNVKQSGIGLVVSIGATLAIATLAHPGTRKLRALLTVTACLVPAALMFGLWRIYVSRNFPTGELQMMEFADWNWRLLPSILLAVAKTMLQKAAFFLGILVVFVLAARRLRMRVWDRQAMLFGMNAGVTALYVVFLLFTYVAHFDPDSAADAHSFFRYMQQLSLTTMMALTYAARPWIARWLSTRSAMTCRRLGVASVVCVTTLPFALIGVLRFDLDAPQPTIWTLARAAADLLTEPRLALLLPGDVDDGVGSMLRGVIVFVPARHTDMEFDVRLTADRSTLASVAAGRYDTALISCTSADLAEEPGLASVPAGVAALVRHSAAGWRPVQIWRYPADLARHRFSGQIERAPLCAGPVRDVSPAIAWHRPA